VGSFPELVMQQIGGVEAGVPVQRRQPVPSAPAVVVQGHVTPVADFGVQPVPIVYATAVRK
jgi:hypothetical protein